MDLHGARALVTGGAAGIGAAVAERLGAAGVHLTIADLDVDTGAATAARLGARFVAADLAEPDGAYQLMAVLGPLDVLVNNAGGVVSPRYPRTAPEHWLRMLDLNLRSVMVTTQLALDGVAGAPGGMRARGGGAIVNVASSAGLGFGVHSVPEYAVAKAGVLRLTACLAPLREECGVRVNCVCPDLVDTPASRRGRVGATPEELAAEPAPIPAAEVAEVVAGLLTDDAMAGRVVVCQDAEPRQVLVPAEPWAPYLRRLA